ncbi:SMI1/KNR4 family protein [Streptomyces sp. NPDC102402]|uniref:SMI1/KNR4 family protein n=1 Tax=Streptomyces sp. NPDC102402 TaxID=3366169 RepID=UPI00380A6AB6
MNGTPGAGMIPGTTEGGGGRRIMVEQAVRAVVEAIVAKAPGGRSQAVLHCRADAGGTSLSGGYSAGGHLPSLWTVIRPLTEAVRQECGRESVSIELRTGPSGEYRLVVCDDAVRRVTGTGRGFRVILDPGHRVSRPGMHQEAGTAGPAGDPELAVDRFHTYLERRAAILGRREELPPPATPAAIDAAERELGRRLPADLRALYLIADGDCVGLEPRYLFQGSTWLSLGHLVTARDGYGATEPPWSGWGLEWDAVIFDADPAETVRRCAGHPGWLRFASGEDGNYLAVDTAPARNGRPGQVIRTGRDHHRGPSHVADSVTSLLGHYLELLDRGAYAYEEEDDYLELLEPDRAPTRRESLDGIPDEIPPTLQAVRVNDATGPVELSRLATAHRLRSVRLAGSATADLSPVRELPVEALNTTAEGAGLAPLAGHPHLASLGLRSTTPVDLTPLRSVPRLHGLDLAEAEVADLDVLSGLEGLRYLALTRAQWGTLLNEGGAPPALAAGCLTDSDSTLDEALALAARLGLETGAAFRLTGSLETDGG